MRSCYTYGEFKLLLLSGASEVGAIPDSYESIQGDVEQAEAVSQHLGSCLSDESHLDREVPSRPRLASVCQR